MKYGGYNLNGEQNWNLRLWRYNGSDWIDKGGVVNHGSETVTAAGVSQFSDWTLADSTGSIQPPIPEIVTIVMISIGILILGGFVWYRRREIASGIAGLFV